MTATHSVAGRRPVFAQADLVRRGVVLYLLARGELVAAGSYHRRLPDPMAAAEGGQRLIRQRRPARHQFLMDPDQVPLALVHQLQNLLPVGLGLLRTVELVELQSHGRHRFGISLEPPGTGLSRRAGEVLRELAWNHSHVGGSGLSRCAPGVHP